jgi:integrase
VHVPRPRVSTSIWAKDGYFYGAYYDERDKRRIVSTGITDDGTKKARDKATRRIQALQADVKREVAGLPDETDLTVSEYAKRFHEERTKAGIQDARNEWSRLRLHALPVLVNGKQLGDYRLRDVGRSHIKTFVRVLKGNEEMAPRSRYHVYNTLHLMFAEALDEERIDVNPCSLKREKYLGAKVDKDPEWRRTAKFALEEAQLLLYAPVVPWVRRTINATFFLTGMRFGELVALRWRHLYENKPLHEILVAHSHNRKRTKTEIVRRVPVHPTLAAFLKTWREQGWPIFQGREPQADDLIFPTERGTMKRQQGAWESFQLDLDALGLARRRQHDARRTFISLARAAGCNLDLIKVMTHGLSQSRIMDVYTDEESLWAGLCAELVKVRLDRPENLPEGPESGRSGFATHFATSWRKTSKSAKEFERLGLVPGAGLEKANGKLSHALFRRLMRSQRR